MMPTAPGTVNTDKENPMHSREFWQQTARASWMAAVIATAASMVLSNTIKDQSPVASAAATTIITTLLASIGLGCGLAAIVAARTHGRSGILSPAVVGTIVNAGFLALIAIGLVSGTRRAEAARAEERRLGEESLLNYAGWLGAGFQSGVVVTASEVKEQSGVGQSINSLLLQPVQPFLLTVENRTGAAAAVVDPWSTRLLLADGRQVAALARSDIHPKDASAFDARHRKPVVVPPGVSNSPAWALFPLGTATRDVVQLSLVVNGSELKIPGRYFSAAEKRKLFEAAKANQARPASK
jgi:hypothetical protein